jgi:hypothetical protein
METEKGSPAENRTSRASRFKGGGIITKLYKCRPVTRQSYNRGGFFICGACRCS